MKIKRLVADVATNDPKAARSFYPELLGLEVLMDLDWIVTYGSDEKMKVQISFMSEGGSGAPTPDLPIAVSHAGRARPTDVSQAVRVSDEALSAGTRLPRRSRRPPAS
jgi:hypothetical protein